METNNKTKTPKEIDVFNRFSHRNKFKVTLITLAIALVSFLAIYFFAKSILTYTISYETYGVLVFGEELKDDTYHFLEKTRAPKNLKKEGYYIEGFYEDEAFTKRYKFGNLVWNSAHLYVNWQPGYAVQLFFAEGEEEKSKMTEEYLKLYHEQYVAPNSNYTLPRVYNDIKEDEEHYGEQLLWFENPECTGDPIVIKTFKLSENIKVYGKWFDTKKEKFDVTEDGTLNRYLGKCDKIMLPSNVKKIKDINYDKFTDYEWNPTNTADGSPYSAFDRVLKEVEVVYINKECEELGSCALRGATNLKNIYFLGDKITRIGDYAFAFCSSLEKINIPDGVKEIEKRVFYNTGVLSPNKFTVTGMKNIETIGDDAFTDSRILSLELPKVSFIGKRAFSSCQDLKTIVLNHWGIVQTGVTDVSADINLNNNVLFGSTKYTIYVPLGFVEAYKIAYGWSSYASRIQPIIEEV